MKNVLEVIGLAVETVEVAEGSRKKLTVTAYMPGNIELDPDDMALLVDLLNEAASRFEGGSAEAEPEPAEPEPQPEQPRRRRGAAAAEPEPEAEKEEAKPRRRRGAAAAEPEPEKEEAEPRRRRRAAEPEAPKGPSADDVAKAASLAAEKLGPKITSEIIMDYSEDGKLGGIPAEKRQAFIDEINFELNGE